METNVIVIIAAIIVGLIVLKFITKVIVKLVSFALVAGFVVFVLFYWNGGVLNTGNSGFMLDELEQKYCHEQVSEVKCNCIIEPISKDIRAKYSKQELAKLQQNKLKSVAIIGRTAVKHKKEIRDCLRANNALDEWDKFMKDLKNLDIENKLDKFFKSAEKITVAN